MHGTVLELTFKPVSFKTHFIFINKPLHWHNFILLASSLQAGKGNQRNNQLSSPFHLNRSVILISRLAHHNSLSLLTSFLLSRTFNFPKMNMFA